MESAWERANACICRPWLLRMTTDISDRSYESYYYYQRCEGSMRCDAELPKGAGRYRRLKYLRRRHTLAGVRDGPITPQHRGAFLCGEIRNGDPRTGANP